MLFWAGRFQASTGRFEDSNHYLLKGFKPGNTILLEDTYL